MRANFFLLSFFIISFIHLGALSLEWESPIYWTKFLLMPMLFLAMWRGLAANEIQHAIKAAGFALFFSTAGDVLLLIEHTYHQDIYFYLGLGSFLLAQICYIYAFMRLGKLPISYRWMVLYILYYAGFIWILSGVLPGPLLIAVLLYGSSLSAMAWNSWRTVEGTGWLKFGGVIGATLFVLSDSILAINRFRISIPYSGLWIMSTYITAQYLIIRSIVIRSRMEYDYKPEELMASQSWSFNSSSPF